jgi:hypothetical protein
MLAPVLSQPALPLNDPPASRSRRGDQGGTRPARAGGPHRAGLSLRRGPVLPRASASPPMRRRSATASSDACSPTARQTPMWRRSSRSALRAAQRRDGPPVDAAGQPTIEARDEILAFFTQRLVPDAGAPHSAGSRGESQ